MGPRSPWQLTGSASFNFNKGEGPSGQNGGKEKKGGRGFLKWSIRKKRRKSDREAATVDWKLLSRYLRLLRGTRRTARGINLTVLRKGSFRRRSKRVSCYHSRS